jgi:hypothetical protein
MKRNESLKTGKERRLKEEEGKGKTTERGRRERRDG